MTNERKPHKHAEIIKAWADGAEIQYFNGVQWYNCHNNKPDWDSRIEYRIKPEPSDLEKYGVEVGDVWRVTKGNQKWVLLSRVKPKHVVCQCIDQGGTYSTEIDNLSNETLIFRRGVVNKL